MTDSVSETSHRATTRDEQREASRRKLVDAALVILAEDGYKGLTVKRVGERAGVSRGLVNYHFTSKAGLIEAVVADIREGFVEHVRSVPGYARMSGLEAVIAKVDQYFARLGEPRSNVRARALLVLLVEAVGGSPGLHEMITGHFDLVRSGIEDDIRRGIDDASIRADVDAGAQAFLVESMARGVLLQYQLDVNRAHLPDIGRAARDSFIRALSA